MSRPTPCSEKTDAASGPREDAGEIARREAGIVRARRRLRIVTSLGDLAMTLAEAVHERALAEEAAAKAALALQAAARVEPGAERHVKPETLPSQDTSSQTAEPTARSGDPTRPAPRAQSRVASRVESPGAWPAPAMTAGALFARLSDIVRQCLELELRIEEELRRLEAAWFVTREPDAPERTGREEQQTQTEEDASRGPARDRVCAMVEAVIEDEAKTSQKARKLYDALRERLDEDEACRDLASRPDAVRAASLCRDLGLHPNPSRWAPPPDP